MQRQNVVNNINETYTQPNCKGPGYARNYVFVMSSKGITSPTSPEIAAWICVLWGFFFIHIFIYVVKWKRLISYAKCHFVKFNAKEKFYTTNNYNTQNFAIALAEKYFYFIQPDTKFVNSFSYFLAFMTTVFDHQKLFFSIYLYKYPNNIFFYHNQFARFKVA